MKPAHIVLLALACVLASAALPVYGQAPVPVASAAVQTFPQQIQASQASQAPLTQADAVPDQLRMFLEKETTGFAGRLEVSIGAPGTRLQLAPCANPQPFVPSGARLWGRTTLGVRCVEGAAWQVFLPVNIKVYGQAPVATHQLNAGDSLGEGDMRFEEIELTRYPLGAIADPAQWTDKQLSRPVAPGQPFLRDGFRARTVLAQGDNVKLVYTGQGFSVSTQARALSAAVDGQSVRVVTDAGKTISGTAHPNHVVEIKY